MRPELNLIEKIEQYLLGKLSSEDAAAFKSEMDKDPNLKAQVTQQKEIMEAFENKEIKQKYQKAKKKYWTIKITIVSAIVIISSITGYMLFSVLNKDKTPEEHPNTNISYLENENGSENWADADEQLPLQLFFISSKKDTVLTTESGLHIAVPAGSFSLDGNPITENITLEFKEAITPADILTSGLSTTSNGGLLETAGMYYINARKDGKNLDFNKTDPILVSVPDLQEKAGMQLYQGEREDNGNINWVNPKPLESFLKTMDIHQLDFYPPCYEPSIKEQTLADNSREWKDSMYYSYAYQDCVYTDELPHYYLNPASVKTIWEGENYQNTILATKEFEARMHYLQRFGRTELLELYINNLDKNLYEIDAMVLKQVAGYDPEQPKEEIDGMALFNNNCASCHHPTKDGTGPAMAFARNRWDSAGEGKFIYEFVNNNGALRFSGKSKRANQIFKEWNGALMSNFQFTIEEIDAILDYCDNIALQSGETYPTTKETLTNYESDIMELKDSLMSIVAMKASEEKAVAIKPCEKCITQSEFIKQFEYFYSLKQGKVEIDNTAGKQLAKFYQTQSKKLSAEIANIQKEYSQAYNKLAKENAGLVNTNNNKNTAIAFKNLQQEQAENVKYVFDKLGIKSRTFNANRLVGAAPNPGWYNIDKIVKEKTTKRESMQFKYENKTATILYQEAVFSIKEENQYDKTFVYLLPQQLNSYQRINKNQKGEFKEKLNSTFNYDAVGIGLIEDQPYLEFLSAITNTSYQLNLKATSKDEINNVFGKLKGYKQKKDIETEILEQLKINKQEKEMNKIQNIIMLRNNIFTGTFCANIVQAEEVIIATHY